MSFLMGAPYTSSQADTNQPTVTFPGGIGSLSAGEIRVTAGGRFRVRRRRTHGRHICRTTRRNRTVRNRRVRK